VKAAPAFLGRILYVSGPGGVGAEGGVAVGVGSGAGFFWYGKKKARWVMEAKSVRSSLPKVTA